MLVIRMQRTGRKGHAMFRVVVQDSRRTPTSGKIVAQVGSYDPHTKTVNLDKEKAAHYLNHGAQPSDRVARLLKAEGVKLPSWVKLEDNKQRTTRNADKRRSTRPPEPEAPAAEETAPEAETAEAEKPAEEVAEANETEAPEAETSAAEEPTDTEDKPAEEADDESKAKAA